MILSFIINLVSSNYNKSESSLTVVSSCTWTSFLWSRRTLWDCWSSVTVIYLFSAEKSLFVTEEAARAATQPDRRGLRASSCTSRPGGHDGLFVWMLVETSQIFIEDPHDNGVSDAVRKSETGGEERGWMFRGRTDFLSDPNGSISVDCQQWNI